MSRRAPWIRVRDVAEQWSLGKVTGQRATEETLREAVAAAQPDWRSTSTRGQSAMVRFRGLREYRGAFGERFDRALAELGPRDTWIDVGAGEGKAVAGYLRTHPEGGRAIAVDFGDDARPEAEKLGGRMEVVKGDVTQVSIDRRARLLTDVFGAMSYGAAPDKVIERYGQLVEPGGEVMMVIAAEGRNKVLSPDGRQVSDLVDYLRQVKGFEVVGDPVQLDKGQRVVLRRTQGAVKAPAIELVRFEDRGPPARVFRLRAPGEHDRHR